MRKTPSINSNSACNARAGPYKGASPGLALSVVRRAQDYVCGSVQFSIRPKDGLVVWKQKNMPFETSPIIGWAPQEIEWRFPSPHAPPVIERRFLEVWFGPKIHFVQRTYGPFLVKGANSWLCIREIDQKLDVTPG